MPVEFREMTTTDYQAVTAPWRAAEGVVLREADRLDAIARYLGRIPAPSFVAVDRERLVGTVLCGHDGRRGYLEHIVVAAPYRPITYSSPGPTWRVRWRSSWLQGIA